MVRIAEGGSGEEATLAPREEGVLSMRVKYVACAAPYLAFMFSMVSTVHP